MAVGGMDTIRWDEIEGLPGDRLEAVDSPVIELASAAIYREGIALEALLSAGIDFEEVAPVSGLQTPEEMEIWLEGEAHKAARAARHGFGTGTNPRDLKPDTEFVLPDEDPEAVPIHAMPAHSSPEALAEADRVLREHKREAKLQGEIASQLD